jgi:hypothetical protein
VRPRSPIESVPALLRGRSTSEGMRNVPRVTSRFALGGHANGHGHAARFHRRYLCRHSGHHLRRRGP